MPAKRSFQPLFLENLALSMPGITIRRFAHHRHSDGIDLVDAHRHSHSQFLLYLRGRGIQTLGSDSVSVMRGSLIYLPPAALHGFLKSMKAAPLSIVFDFKEKQPLDSAPISLMLSQPVLSQAERLLHQLVHSSKDSATPTPTTAAESLTLFALLHQSTLGAKDPVKAIHPVTNKVRKWLRQSGDAALKPSVVAGGLEEDLSSLNRKLRHECGLNLGKLIDEHRLELSCDGLRDKRRPIAEVAWDAGFQDPNYFARWFRRKVGQSPREWRQGL